jgi:hypothetical protein
LFSSSISLLLTLNTVPGSPDKTVPPPIVSVETQKELPPIRPFDVVTLAALGQALYRHDQWAWVATDVLAEKIGLEKYGAEGACGWVVDDSREVPFVRFLRKRGEGVEAAYDVKFPKDKSPILEVPHERKLTPRQQLHAQARESARKRMVEGRFPLCEVRRNYNTVVLDDPGGKGFLVYWLRPKEVQGRVPIGGHYRLSLSADGAIVTQVDRLSASCLTLEAPREKEGAKAEYLFVTHVVSNTPLETHVFLSLQEKLPFYVAMNDRDVWVTDKGKIIHLGKLPESDESLKDTK